VSMAGRQGIQTGAVSPRTVDCVSSALATKCRPGQFDALGPLARTIEVTSRGRSLCIRRERHCRHWVTHRRGSRAPRLARGRSISIVRRGMSVDPPRKRDRGVHRHRGSRARVPGPSSKSSASREGTNQGYTVLRTMGDEPTGGWYPWRLTTSRTMIAAACGPCVDMWFRRPRKHPAVVPGHRSPCTGGQPTT